MARSRKPVDETTAVSAHWQSLFITAVVVAWLSQIAYMLLRGIATYTSSGTWAFQISLLLFPLAFFVIAFAILSHYTHPIRRLFMACLASVIGVVFYSIVAQWEVWLWSDWYTYYHPISASDTSWWTAFGNDWALMLLSLLVFAAGLYTVTRKSRR